MFRDTTHKKKPAFLELKTGDRFLVSRIWVSVGATGGDQWFINVKSLILMLIP